MKKLLSMLLGLLAVFGLVSCGETGQPTGDQPSVPATDLERFNGLTADASGSLDVMVWSGDGQYYEDLGHQNWEAKDIKGQNVAALYATAKEFNKLFPKVKINVYSKLDGPDDGGVSWEQEIENFKTEYGKYPDIWASNNVPRDISKGLVLNLTEFKDNAYYKEMNEGLLSMTNYYGFQGALPQYILPWAVYVNRELAEENNIQAPDPDWTWAQYTNFVKKAKPEDGFYGSWDAGMDIVRWATIEAQMQHGTVEGAYIDIDTSDFKNAIRNLPTQATTAVLNLQGRGDITSEDMVNLGNWWGYKAFADGKLLTYTGDPWMLGSSNVKGTSNTVLSDDWDIYPCPSINGEDNFVSAVLDPVCIYNYYGKNAVGDENQQMKAKIAYAFTAFWTADTRSWQARADQQFAASVNADGSAVLQSSLNDSFPIITGDKFDEQMEIWYSTEGHAAYANADKFPGFAKVLEVWNAGQINCISDKAHPVKYSDSNGTAIDCFEYIRMYSNPDYIGNVTIFDETWAATYIAGIKEWNEKMNGYIDESYAILRSALKDYYGFKDSDFN